MLINRRNFHYVSGARTARLTRCWRYRIFGALWSGLVLLVVFGAPSNPAWATHLSWHEYSDSYEVYLGVVPATMADRDTALLQMHDVSPHGKVERSDALRHVMVSVFRRSGGERVATVHVSAEVVENDLIHLKRTKKNLDVMILPGGVSYCNFFTLHWNGMYEIKVRILEPGKGTEWVTFNQKETAL